VELLGNCSANDFPMTYAGGVSTLEDLERIKHLGNGKIDATIGSALDIFGGNLAFTSVLDWSNKQ
jgi:phosphoribosylformimino-5-aminoimidazole carboxamide ribotide isomerase